MNKTKFEQARDKEAASNAEGPYRQPQNRFINGANWASRYERERTTILLKALDNIMKRQCSNDVLEAMDAIKAYEQGEK